MVKEWVRYTDDKRIARITLHDGIYRLDETWLDGSRDRHNAGGMGFKSLSAAKKAYAMHWYGHGGRWKEVNEETTTQL